MIRSDWLVQVTAGGNEVEASSLPLLGLNGLKGIFVRCCMCLKDILSVVFWMFPALGPGTRVKWLYELTTDSESYNLDEFELETAVS
jgi:hypothetical protein